MAHIVLSRKLRPKTFQEVAGQDHIVNALKNSISSDSLAHAYLFAGTRGVGKTTIARLFSRAIRCSDRDENQNPCGECSSCINADVDIIEIDGASNNSVENMRDLISTVQYLPAHGKYRVFVIDEVHMLSTSAFNALLKTLEEPPEHVKFIFATTDPQKLIDTVLSRCIRFDLRPLSTEKLVEILNEVVVKEKIEVDSEKVVELIARCGKGSLRDSLSLMEQSLSYSENRSISFQDLEDALGIANVNEVNALISAMIDGQDKSVSDLFRKIVAKGIFLDQLCMSILENLYEKIINEEFNDLGMNESFWIYETLTKDFNWSLKSVSPAQTIELVLKKISKRREFFSGQTIVKKKLSPDQDAAKKALVSENKPDCSEAVDEVTEEEQAANEELKKKIFSDSLDHLDKVKPAEKGEELEALKVEEPLIDLPSVSERDLSFEGFLEHIGEYSPAMRTNLQHGNFLKDLEISDGVLDMDVAFKDSAEVFAEYFKEKDIQDKLIRWTKQFFEVERVNLNISVLKKEDKDNFTSVNEKIIKQEELDRQNRQEELETCDNVKLAEDIFSSKVDKVILNEKNK